MSSIKISPKHGLNPSVLKCFWCGEDIGLALCGRMKGDEQAPPFMIGSYEPCDKCKENFAKGILAIGVCEHPIAEDFPPVCKDENGNFLYPDGSHIVLTEQGVKRILNDQVIIDEVIKRKAMFMSNIIVHQLVEDATKLSKEERQNEHNNCGVSSD